MPELFQLFCPIRKKWVAATPEEKVRQSLILSMTQTLGYPMGHLALEKSLRQMPHLSSSSALPSRRTDIVVLAQGLHPLFALYPLLLIECKAVPFTPKVVRQVVGYNHYLKAYFIALVNQKESRLGWYHPERKELCFLNGLPSYSELILQGQFLSKHLHPKAQSQ